MKRKLPDTLKSLKSKIKVFVQENEKDMNQCILRQNNSKKSRKVQRKEVRKLKKIRMDAFKRNIPMPTLESLQKDKELLEESRKKRKLKLDKIRQKRIRKKLRKQLQLKHQEERKEDLEIVNKQDNKILKDLEKKLGIKKKKSGALPSSFQRDNMDYVLNYMEEAHGARTVFENSDNDDSLTFKKNQKDFKYNSEDDLTSKDDEDISSEDDGEIFSEINDDDDSNDIDDDTNESDNRSYNWDDDDEDNEYQNDENEKQIISDSDVDVNNKSLKNIEEQYIDNRNILKGKNILKNNAKENIDGMKEKKDKKLKDNLDDKKEKKILNTKSLHQVIKHNPSNILQIDDIQDLKEDIYGRLKDTQGNIVSKVYQPPAKRKSNEEESINNDVLNKQIHAIINRLTETNMSHYVKELSTLFGSHSRAIVSETLANVILNSISVHSLLPLTSLTNFAFLISILHSIIGVEVSSTFLQLLMSSLLRHLKIEISENILNNDNISSEEFDDITSSKIKNTLSIFVKLYSFKVIENTLILEFINYLLRFSLTDIISLDFMFKEIGFDLRKDDVVAFKELYSKIINKGELLEKTRDKKIVIFKNLLDTLRLIKNNQKHKMVDFDEEGINKRKKDLKVFTSGNQASAIHVTLKDLAYSREMGKWWLIGSAWAGRINEDNKMPILKNVEHNETLKQFEKNLLDKARRHHMNTSVKKIIFCTIMTSTDYRDAFERLIKLKLTSEQQRDILQVILNLVIKEVPYNQFYAELAHQFCAFHRKYLMACKFSIWDQLKSINSVAEKHIENFSNFFLQLIIKGSLQLPVLKVIEFAEIEKSTVTFLKKFLTSYFSSNDINEESITKTFSYISSNSKLTRFKSGLMLFLRQFLVKDLNENIIEKVRKANRLLEVHSTSDNVPTNWDSID